MKKLTLLIGFILIGILGFSQSALRPVRVVSVVNATTAFGENISVDNQVINNATGEVWLCRIASVNTLTLTTGSANFTIVNGGGSTNLSEGTSTTTTVDVNSSTGTNATLLAASTSRAGVMTKAKYDEVVANTAKVTNATHTGDVTGATVLTIANDAVDDNHVNWGTGANQVSAADVPIADAGSKITATEVEGALQENRTAIDLNTAKVGVTDGDKGDITVSGTGTTWTIDNDAVTYAKMQNVVDDERILGRVSGANGVVEELTATQVKTMLNITSGAQVNYILFTEKFEEDDGTPTAHSLTHTAQTAGATVSLNGTMLNPADYTFTATTLTSDIPVSQYDVIVVTYNYAP